MSEPVSLDRGRIRLGGLLIYLEHAVRPADLLPRGVVPRAYGVAPTALSAEGEVLVAVASDESVWLGFEAVDRSRAVRVRVRVEHDEMLDAMTGTPWEPDLVSAPRNHLLVPPDSWLVGVPRPAGVEPFTAPVRMSVIVVDPASTAEIHLVDPAVFEQLTGRRPPRLDRRRGYTGWRAP